MIKNIVLRDNNHISDLYPFSILHPSFEMRCGCLRIFEKYKYYFPKANIRFKSDELRLKSFLKRFDILDNSYSADGTLFIDGNLLPSFELCDYFENQINKLNANISFVYKDEEIAYFYLNDTLKNIEKVEIEESFVHKINYLWEALDFNANEIEADLKLTESRFKKYDADEHKHSIAVGSRLFLGNNVEIAPGVVLDSSEGSIVIDDNTKLMPNSVILGPAYIGKNNIIKIGAKIYPYCSFGEYCKVGGELEATIIQAYSNKQHEGFLGHSYICEWVNLGADTNNSDLKNTYSSIIMRIPGKRIPSGKMFIGLMAGDHTKSAINSQFTTGTTAGIHCNLFESGFFPNQIPSFAWGGQSKTQHHKFEQAIDTAKIAMGRRKREINEFEIELMRAEYNNCID